MAKQCKAAGCTHIAEYRDGLCAECADGDRVVQVLCQCGWGNLGMRTTEVPHECPVCGHGLAVMVELAGMGKVLAW